MGSVYSVFVLLSHLCGLFCHRLNASHEITRRRNIDIGGNNDNENTNDNDINGTDDFIVEEENRSAKKPRLNVFKYYLHEVYFDM